MSYKFLTAALLLTSVVATAATSQGSAPAAKPADATKPSDDDIVCTYEERMGSHLKKKVCQTRAQMNEQRDADQAAMRNLQRGGVRSNNSTGPVK